MFFNADDDDHDFLSTSGGSKLASLFGTDRASDQGGNESLTYTAPKQPKKKEPAGQAAGSLLFATAVHCYKYVDGQYASQGKLGAAVLGNPATQDYRILLYVSKQQQVTSARITSAFSFTIQQNNYASFYDDSRQTWSLMFDNEQNAVQFAKQIGLAKACSSGNSLDSVVTQDLRLGDGGALDSGDLVEVKYTGWLLTNGTFGQEFDSNVKTDKQFKFKIGKGKVIKAWDQGVIGMKKGTKRLIIAPPNLAYGSQGMGSRVPPNSTLIFEVEVVRVKIAKTESPKPSPAPTPEPVNPSPAPSSDVDTEDSSVRGRTKSINDQMNQQSSGGKTSGKAKLISRMAKMGKPMLPLVGAVAAQPDSDEEAVPESPQQISESPVNVQPVKQTVKPPVVAKPVPQHPVTMETQSTVYQTGMANNPVIQQQQLLQPVFTPPAPAGQQLALYQNPQAILQQQQAALLQQQQLQQQQQQTQFPPTGPQPGYPGSFPPPQYPAQYYVSQPNDSATPMLLTESRQQNTELRLAVGKVSDKVDRVMEKLDHMQTQQNGSLAVQSSSPNMEASVLMYNVQRIVQDNERLKKELYEKSVKVESMNEKISELLQSNQMFVEKSQTLLEQRNEGFKTTATQSQARVLALEQDKVQLATELSTATSQLSTLQLEIASLKKKELELNQKLDSSSQGVKKNTEEIDTLRSQHAEDEEKIKELTTSLKEEKQHRKTIDNKLAHVQEEFLDLKTTKDVLEKNLSERKKKSAEERRQMEEEMEDMKSQLEAELQTLRERLRRQKTSTDAVAAEQVSQVEKELNEEWRTKCDKLLSNAQEKHNRVLQDLKEEKGDLEQKVEVLEAKIHTLKTSNGSSDDTIKNLQDEIEELTGWKTKYENLRTQASSMKEKYEERISDLEEEREQLSEDKDALQQKVKGLQEAKPSAEQEAKSTTPSGGQESVVAEVKKIMNSVYQQLRSKFTAEETYAGTVVLGAILETIKATTLKLVQTQSSVTEEKEDSEEEEEEEELSEDEEEDDEEEEEKADEPVKTSPKTDNNEASSEPVQTEQTSVEQAPAETEQAVDDAEQTTVPQNKDSEEESDFDDSEPDEPIPPVPQEPSSPEKPESATEQENVELPDSSGDKHDQEEAVEEVSQSEPETVESPPVTNHVEEEDKTDDRVKEEQTSHIPTVSSRTPPPLIDEDDDDNSDENANNENRPLFGDDDTVEDTLGISYKTPKSEEAKDKTNKKDQENEEDLKPKPPPPLFGSDDDDDDLDWLS